MPNLRIRGKREAFSRGAKQILDLFGRQIGGRTAAPMKLHHFTFTRNSATHALHFVLQHAEIRRRDSLIFLNDHVACAKQTQAFAEGKMHVQRNRRLRRVCLFMHFFQIIRPNASFHTGAVG